MAIWPFGRRRDADEPTPEPDAAESASPTAGEADVARPDRVPTGDWMTMPPVRTSMAPAMPTTFRVQTLPEILTSHHDTRLSSSLGHAVSSDAPSGVIGGLARATSSLGAVSHEGTGGAPSVLKEPAHPARPEPDPAPPIQRRLAASTDAPLAVSSPGPLGTTLAPPAPALPEPAVSRVLASPGPMPSPAALGANPLPVARVIDTTPAPPRSAAASTVDSPTSPASSPSSSEGSTAAPPAGAEPGPAADDRVGGFDVDLASLLGGQAGDDDLPVITPPADLAPPIQRSVRRDSTPPTLRSPVQRSADRAAPSPAAPAAPAITSAPPASAAPTGATGAESAPPASGTAEGPGSPAGAGNTADLPPIQRRSDTSPASSTSDSSASSPSGGPSPAGAEMPAPLGARPTAGADALAPADTSPLSSGGTATPAPAGAGPDLTLASRPVQRSAAAGADTGHFPGDGHDHGDDEGAVQRTADAAPTLSTPDSPSSASASAAAAPAPAAPTAADGHTGDDAPAAGSSVEVSATAPTAGDDPLTPVSDVAPLTDDGAGDDLAGDTAGEALPLVARHAEPAAPTLGSTGDPGPNLLPLQTLSDTAQSHTEGASPSLPLAPPDQPGTLTPPAAPGPIASTSGLVGDGPLPTVSGPPSTPSTAGPASTTSPRALTAQRQAESGASTSAGGPGPLAVAAHRSVAGPARGESAAATTAPSLRPLASSAGSLLLASPAATGGPGTTPSGPMTVLGGLSPEATAVPLQRSVGADGFAAPILAAPPARSGAGTTAPDAGAATATPSGPPLPLARSTSAASGGTTEAAATPVTPLVAQRAADDGASSSSSAMPLHTAAAAVPSTTDLLVKAGLGEKGPDGSFLRSTPPAGVASSFTVQTMPDGTTPAPSPSAPSLQREISVGSMSTEVGGSGGGGAAESPEDVRKLYRKLRAELEADLRRQLEAKSRYNRYRP